MQVTIEIPTSNNLESISIKMALEKIAKTMNKSNIMFLAEMCDKKDINTKLENKKTLIKTFL